MNRLTSRLLLLAAVLTSCVVSPQARADDTPSPPAATAPASQPATTPSVDADLAATLDTLAAKAAEIHDLSAQFVQTKTTPLLRRPLVSHGQINVRGSQTRWLTLKPRPSAMSTSATEIHLHYPDQKLVEIYPLDRKLSELVASPLPQLEILRRHFDIALVTAADTGLSPPQEVADAIHLRLTPRDEQIAGHVQRIDVMVNSANALAVMMAMTNAAEERTVVEFTQVRINPGLTDEDLRIDTPAGTRITRPLDTKQAP